MIQEPEILKRSTYFWQPNGTASGRRNAEERYHNQVSEWLVQYGFSLSHEIGAEKTYQRGDIAVSFAYKESTRHVYKSLSVWEVKIGKKHNIVWLRNRLG